MDESTSSSDISHDCAQQVFWLSPNVVNGEDYAVGFGLLAGLAVACLYVLFLKIADLCYIRKQRRHLHRNDRVPQNYLSSPQLRPQRFYGDRWHEAMEERHYDTGRERGREGEGGDGEVEEEFQRQREAWQRRLSERDVGVAYSPKSDASPPPPPPPRQRGDAFIGLDNSPPPAVPRR